MLEEIAELFQAPLGIWEAVVRVGVSLAASTVAYLLYQVFYESRHIGAGVHRVFLVGGPAITMIFLVIQTSIPLGIGLLGALSFVRFRTPIKDPAEIGFLLLLIASSIGAATGNLMAIVILFAVVALALWLQRLIGDHSGISGRGHLMISIDQPSFPAIQEGLTSLLQQRLRRLSLETMSTIDGRVALHYQYRRESDFDWPGFTSELNKLAAEAKVEVFIS